jgi:plastocyanin
MRRRYALPLFTSALLLIAALGFATSAAAGGGCHAEGATEAVASEAAATVVKIDGCTFAPSVTRVPTGTEVRFINSSPAQHDVIGRMGGWGIDTLPSGAEFKHRFATAGVYPYSCSLHPGMAGVVIVGSPASAAAPDTAPVAASEPIPEDSTASDSGLPMLAVGGIGLLAGAAIGVLAARAFGRRDEAA